MKYTIHLLTALSIFFGFVATANSFPVFVDRENVPVEKQVDRNHDAKQKNKHTSKDDDKKQSAPAKASAKNKDERR